MLLADVVAEWTGYIGGVAGGISALLFGILTLRAKYKTQRSEERRDQAELDIVEAKAASTVQREESETSHDIEKEELKLEITRRKEVAKQERERAEFVNDQMRELVKGLHDELKRVREDIRLLELSYQEDMRKGKERERVCEQELTTVKVELYLLKQQQITNTASIVLVNKKLGIADKTDGVVE